MQWIAALAVLVQLFAWSAPASAQANLGQRTIVTTSWVEEWDPATQRWVRLGDPRALAGVRASRAPVVDASQAVRVSQQPVANRYRASATRPIAQRAIAQYGPFLVLNSETAALVGSTDGSSPAYFDAMIRDFPGLNTLEMVEAPGTSNDIANLAVGRRIRAQGMDTHVPSHGSVRSGAVELFLAGKRRTADRRAWFAVHSWLDNYGREPDDFAPDAPANRLYLDYYEEMGMSEARARAFYAMTNSVPHHSAKWLRANEMLPWTRPEVSIVAESGGRAWSDRPMIGYLDLTHVNIASLQLAFAKPFLDS